MANVLVEKRNKLDALSKRLKLIFEQSGGPDVLDMSKVTELTGSNADKAAAIAALNVEMGELGVDMQSLQDLLDTRSEAERINRWINDPAAPAPQPGGGPVDRGNPMAAKFGGSIGEIFVKSPGYQANRGRTWPGGEEVIGPGELEAKTLFQTSAGWAPESIRTGRVVEDAQRPIQIIDMIPAGRTGQAAVVYMEETTFTNAAAERAEAGAYAEAALALTERSNTVRSIGVSLPVTDEQLDDEAQVESYLNNRLPFMIRQRLDSQLLVGNGTPPNLEGILNVTGIQTQAIGGDTALDAIYKAMDLIRVTGRAIPSGLILHPNDWQPIRLLRTADGIYIWGNPSEVGPLSVWGVPLSVSDAITENTGLAGDFRAHSELVERRGIVLEVTDSHNTDFVNGRKMIRAGGRWAFVVYRPAAFCTITGI